jgi:hypothetical protein
MMVGKGGIVSPGRKARQSGTEDFVGFFSQHNLLFTFVFHFNS